MFALRLAVMVLRTLLIFLCMSSVQLYIVCGLIATKNVGICWYYTQHTMWQNCLASELHHYIAIYKLVIHRLTHISYALLPTHEFFFVVATVSSQVNYLGHARAHLARKSNACRNSSTFAFPSLKERGFRQ